MSENEVAPWEMSFKAPQAEVAPWEMSFDAPVESKTILESMSDDERSEYFKTSMVPGVEEAYQKQQEKDAHLVTLPPAQEGDRVLEGTMGISGEEEPGLITMGTVAGETAKGFAGGLSKFPFFVGAMGEKAVNYFTEGELELFDKAMKDNQAMIEAGGPGAGAGDILGQVMGVGTAAGNFFKNIISGSIAGGVVAGGETYASGESTMESIKTGGTVTALMMGIPMSIGAAAGVIKHIEGAVGPLSYGALLLLKNNKHGITKEEAVQLLKDVPKEDQALVLSRRDHSATKIIESALEGKMVNEADLKHLLDTNRKDLYEAAGNIENIVISAKAQFTDMVAMVEKNSNQVFGTNKLVEDLGVLHKFYNAAKNDRAEGIIGKMLNTLEDSPKASLADVVDFRADINYLLSKTTRGKDYIKLNALKTNIDGFIDEWATTSQKAQITKAIDDFANAKQLEEFDEIIIENTELDSGLVNWNKANKQLAKAKLNTPDIELAINIVSKFSEKYGNEVRFKTVVDHAGVNADAGNALSTWSYAVGKVKNILALWGDRYDKLKIQKEILDAVNEGRTYNDFIDKLKTIDGADEIVEEFKLLEYKPGAKLTGDVGVDPLTATEKGTVSVDVSAGILKERQDEIIQSFVKDIPNSQEVTDSAHKLLESTRFNNVLSGVAKKLKADDMDYNVNMLTKIIQREADQLIKQIEKANGVKLPKKEANKLVKLKYEEMLEGCK